jgi:hypothetical protein
VAKALNKLTEFRYVLQEDKDKPETEQTVFKLKPMTGAQRLETIESVSKGNNTQAFITALHYGLVGWERFSDDLGEVKFSPNMSENISRLSASQIMELGAKVRDSSVVEEEERKN